MIRSGYLEFRGKEAFIFTAVNAGSGLVNFDNDLWRMAIPPRYQLITDVFGFGYGGYTAVQVLPSLAAPYTISLNAISRAKPSVPGV